MIKESQKGSIKMEVWKLAKTTNTCFLGSNSSMVYGEETSIDLNHRRFNGWWYY